MKSSDQTILPMRCIFGHCIGDDKIKTNHGFIEFCITIIEVKHLHIIHLAALNERRSNISHFSYI